jgi:AraC-like DNA-binding protein
LSMTPRIHDPGDFEASLDHFAVGASSLNRVTAPPHGVMRTTADISRDSREVFFFNISLNGRCHVVQAGRTYTAASGHLVLIDSREPYSIELPDGGTLLSMSVPQTIMSPCLSRLASMRALAFEPTSANWLLRHHILGLAQMPAFENDEGVAVEQILTGLIQACVQPYDGSASRKLAPSLARLRHLIQREGCDPDFGASRAAERAGLSLRSLHATFARAGTTFGEELMHHRLQLARQRLLAGAGGLRLGDVAREAGFKSLAHFSRRFKARYGTSPSIFSD